MAAVAPSASLPADLRDADTFHPASFNPAVVKNKTPRQPDYRPGSVPNGRLFEVPESIMLSQGAVDEASSIYY